MPPEARDLVLASTLEPCVMCLGASMEAAVDTIVYALKAPADGRQWRNFDAFDLALNLVA